MAILLSIVDHPSKTEAEMAKEIREAMRPALDTICEVMDAAKVHGLRVSFLVGNDARCCSIIQDLTVVKVL